MTTEYNYIDAIKNDIREYLNDHDWIDYGTNIDDVEQQLSDDLWTADSVTGNGSGSYTFNTPESKEYVLADGLDYVRDMVNDGWVEPKTALDHFIDEDWDYFDVSIRCYLLGQCLYDVLREQWPNQVTNPDGTVTYFDIDDEDLNLDDDSSLDQVIA